MNYRIIKQDATEFLQDLEPASVDLLITDHGVRETHCPILIARGVGGRPVHGVWFRRGGSIEAPTQVSRLRRGRRRSVLDRETAF